MSEITLVKASALPILAQDKADTVAAKDLAVQAKNDAQTLVTGFATSVSSANSGLNTIVSNAQTALGQTVNSATTGLNMIVTNAENSIDTKLSTADSLLAQMQALYDNFLNQGNPQ